MGLHIEFPHAVRGARGYCLIGHRDEHIPYGQYSSLVDGCPISFKDSICQHCNTKLGVGESRNHTICNNGWRVCGKCFYNFYCPDGEQPLNFGVPCLKCKQPLRTMNATIFGDHASYNCFHCGAKHIEDYRGTRLAVESPEIPDAKVGKVKWVSVQ